MNLDVSVIIEKEVFDSEDDTIDERVFTSDTSIDKIIFEVSAKYEKELRKNNLTSEDLTCRFEGTFLARSLTCSDAQLRNGTEIRITLRPNTVERMGMNTLKFVDVSPYDEKKELETKKKWSKTAGEHRRWGRGLNMEVICKNGCCGYKGKSQIVPLGFGTFDMIKTMILSVKCRKCGQKVFNKDDQFENFERCGFNSCYFRYLYIDSDGNEGKSKYWIHAPHKPCYLDGCINSDQAQEYFKLEFEVMSLSEYQKGRNE